MPFDLEIQDDTPLEHSNSKNNNNTSYVPRKRLNFSKKGMKKYRLCLEGDVLMYLMHSKTKVEYSWVVNVQEIRDDYYILNIITYDNELKESSEQGLKELFYITGMFQKIYDDIKVKVTLDGNVLQVLNSETLIQKWKRLKKESIKYFGTETNIEEYFAVNDEQFSQPAFLKALVSKAEFFFIFMQAAGYGKKFNSFSNYELIRNNAFERNEIKWIINYQGKNQIKEGSPYGEMLLNGGFEPNKKWIKDSYGDLPFLEVDKLKPQFDIKGRYIFYNSNGWLKEAVLEVNETIDTSKLYHKLKYSIIEID